MLTLNLSTIRAAQERFEKEYAPEALGTDEDFRVVAPVSLAFEIFKDKALFRLVGRVQTTLELPCGRCLEPFTLPVDQAFRPALPAAHARERRSRARNGRRRSDDGVLRARRD